ncbi:hypothetical protein BKA82DRAFT_294327 [Pisolithus tinctorius]|uniref:Uncharacterized protein n=1 Tax=Pisolithus tinctorius Marx 270 TaxID=870435 RepID=A0A0C3JE56_PISTI|nr:hypothetical protein BKA82DRAFT_294327 [Pisolithus tinctorius]KIN95906.1 hypothetical protein M404DRAFT_294327 [Pisolithus tinctorius Marx 270]
MRRLLLEQLRRRSCKVQPLSRLTMTVSEQPIHEGNRKSTTFDLQRHRLRPSPTPPNSFPIKRGPLERERLVQVEVVTKNKSQNPSMATSQTRGDERRYIHAVQQIGQQPGSDYETSAQYKRRCDSEVLGPVSGTYLSQRMTEPVSILHWLCRRSLIGWACVRWHIWIPSAWGTLLAPRFKINLGLKANTMLVELTSPGVRQDNM